MCLAGREGMEAPSQWVRVQPAPGRDIEHLDNNLTRHIETTTSSQGYKSHRDARSASLP